MTSRRGLPRPNAPEEGSSAQPLNCGAGPAPRRFPWLELLVLLSSGLLLVNGGHLGGTDSEAQMIAALALVRTGSPTLDRPCGRTPETDVQWNKGSDGRYYQAHDIGSVLLLAPAALAGTALSKGIAPTDPCHIPPVSKVAAALTYCCTAVLLAGLMAGLARGSLPDVAAVDTALLCVFGTWVAVYSKLPNDVVPGAAATAGAMLCASRLRQGGPRVDYRWAAGLGLSVALAGWFRYTFMPFVAVGALLALWHTRPRLPFASYSTAAAVCLFALVPELVYNYVRTGNALMPALALPQHPNHLTEPIAVGLYRVLLAPNTGLAEFSPLLGLAALGPFLVRRGYDGVRHVAVWFGLASIPYVLLVARLAGAGRGPFGPRLLFVLTPVLCAWLALLIVQYRPLRYRVWRVVVGLAVIGSLVPTLPHLELARSSLVPASMDIRTPWPATHVAVLKAIGLGLTGRELPAPPDVANDPVRSLGRGFPDFWWAHMIRYGGRMRVAGLLIGVVLSAAAIGSALRLRAWGRSLPPEPEAIGS